MSRVVIICPNTGKAVPTGMVAERGVNLSAYGENLFGPCQHCDDYHAWNGLDAFLEEDEAPELGTQEQEDMLVFIDRFLSFLPKLDPERSFLFKELHRIKENLSFSTNLEGSEFDLLKFALLFRDITRLQELLCPHLNRYLKKLRTSNQQNFYGIRLEIRIALILMENAIAKFTSPDPPDFEISFNSAVLKIECTSRHLTASKGMANVLRSLSNCIKKKNRPEYFVDSDSALVIDCTNLLFNNPHLLWRQYSKTIEFVRSEIAQTKYGNVTLCYYYQKIPGRYDFGYNRIDSNPSDSLKGLLDKIFPNSQQRSIRNPIIPSLG